MTDISMSDIFETPCRNIPVQCTNKSSRSRIQKLCEPERRSVLNQDIEVFSYRLNQSVGLGARYCDALVEYPVAFFEPGAAMEAGRVVPEVSVN